MFPLSGKLVASGATNKVLTTWHMVTYIVILPLISVSINLRSSWWKNPHVFPPNSPVLRGHPWCEPIGRNCAKFCFNALDFFPMLWRPKANCEISPLLQSAMKKILLIRALAIQWCAMMCICSCLLLYSVALRRARTMLVQQIFISRPCSLVFEDVFMSISESRKYHYEAPGIDLVAVGRDILQNSHLTAVTKENCSFCPPPFVHKWDQEKLHLLVWTEPLFASWITFSGVTIVKKRFIRYWETAYNLDGIWHVSKLGTPKFSLKGNKKRKLIDSASYSA